METHPGKLAAAKAAVELIENGMRIGLGSGSTVALFLKLLGERCRNGLSIQALPSSQRTARLAQEEAIPLMDEQEAVRLEIAVDGADEIDANKQLIKGGGGALLREKIVAHMAQELIVIVDESKLFRSLAHVPLPLEVLPFGLHATQVHLRHLGLQSTLRHQNGKPYVTDNGNWIVDLSLSSPFSDLDALEQSLHSIPGVLESGLFLNIAGRVFIGHADGTISSR